MTRTYRLELRTELPIPVDDFDEFHALATRVCRATGVPVDSMLLTQDGTALVAGVGITYDTTGIGIQQ